MRQGILIFFAGLFASTAHADFVGYGGHHEVTATSGALKFHHVHDWDSPKLGPLFSDLTRHDLIFSAANDFAFVELREGNKVLFRSPSPALTELWISPDTQFFVGLSHIKLSNPYQLVVWRRDGTLLHREHISDEVAKLSPEQRRDFATRFPKAEQFLVGRYFTHGDATFLDYSMLGVPNEIGDAAWDYLYALRVRHPYSDDFAESVTNVVEWFDRKHSELRITQSGAALILSLRSPTGKRMTIPLKK
jgi:hypothetical protein